MKDQQENILVERAKNWIKSKRVRSSSEQDAYLQGVQDALMSIYQDTVHGAYPAHHMYDVLDEIFGDLT